MSILADLIKLGELWNSWADKAPTEPEKELLIEANKNKGEINIMATGQRREYVMIGEIEYFDEKDPAVRARALESLEKLYRRGLIRHEGGRNFGLSGSGFDVARKLMG